MLSQCATDMPRDLNWWKPEILSAKIPSPTHVTEFGGEMSQAIQPDISAAISTETQFLPSRTAGRSGVSRFCRSVYAMDERPIFPPVPVWEGGRKGSVDIRGLIGPVRLFYQPSGRHQPQWRGFVVEFVDRIAVRSGGQVVVDVHGRLDRRVAELFLHVMQRLALLQEQTRNIMRRDRIRIGSAALFCALSGGAMKEFVIVCNADTIILSGPRRSRAVVYP